MARNTRTYTDIDLNFLAGPSTGDIAKKYDDNAIKQSVRNLILTNHYERLFHPEIGSQISSLLFEPADQMMKAMLHQSITNTIINYEPRVRLTNVEINLNPDNNAVYVSITFNILNTEQPVTVNMILQRTR